jgi:hypothetical protein
MPIRQMTMAAFLRKLLAIEARSVMRTIPQKFVETIAVIESASNPQNSDLLPRIIHIRHIQSAIEILNEYQQ